MDLSTALRAIARSWYLLVIGILAGVAAAVVMHSSEAPLYETSASYVVAPIESTDVSDIAEALRTLDSSSSRAIVATYTEIVTSGVVLSEAGTVIGVSEPDLDAYDVDAGVVPEANVVTVKVSGPSPELVVLLSGAVGDAATARFVASYRIYDVDLLDPPARPSSPINRSLLELAAMAATLGLLGAAAVALLWGAPRLRRAEEMQSRLGSYGPAERVTPIHEQASRLG